MTKYLPNLKKEFKIGDNKEYKIKLIVNSMIYIREIESQMLDLLLGFIEKLPRKKKYLEAFSSSNTPPETNQHLL